MVPRSLVGNGDGEQAAKTLEKADADAKIRRAAIQKALSAFIVRGNALDARLMDSADPTVESESNAWNIEVMTYVAQTLGDAFASRLNSGAGIGGFFKPAPTELRQKIYTSTARIPQRGLMTYLPWRCGRSRTPHCCRRDHRRRRISTFGIGKLDLARYGLGQHGAALELVHVFRS